MDANHHARPTDRGTALAMVVIFVFVISIIVVAVASSSTATLRYGNTVGSRASRVAAAESGMRHTISQLESTGTLCTTASGTGLAMSEPVNGATVTVTCTEHSADNDNALLSTNNWPLIITGRSGNSDDKGLVTSGDTSLIGSIFVASRDRVELGGDLKVENGDVWYHDASCPSGVGFRGRTVAEHEISEFGNITFSGSSSQGVWCVNKRFDELFQAPQQPASLPTNTIADLDGAEQGMCRVFEPGVYESPPQFGAFNYMKSGVYVFDFDDPITIAPVNGFAPVVTAGSGQMTIGNHPDCGIARTADTDNGVGATFYMNEGAGFTITNGSLEIQPRDPLDQGGRPVSIQALGDDAEEAIINVAADSTGDLVVHGYVWAPEAQMTLGPVNADGSAQLREGAVVAGIDLGAAQTTPKVTVSHRSPAGTYRLIAQAKSTDDSVTNVSAIVELRHAPEENRWDVAVQSWRVCEPGDNTCTSA